MHCDNKMRMQENSIMYVMKSNVMICKLTRWLVLNCLLPPTPPSRASPTPRSYGDLPIDHWKGGLGGSMTFHL